MNHSPTFLIKKYSVCAGFPTFGRDQTRFVRLDLNTELGFNPSSTVLCEVTGESMVGAGIYPGDTVLVDTVRTAKNGNIVVAEIDGGRTIKYLRRDNKNIECLQGANQTSNGLIYPLESMSIVGVVVSSFRTYL